MFANTFQSGFISIFYSVGSSPLSLWDKQVKNGHIRRVIDDEVKSLVLEVAGTNVATTYITCPIKPRASLAIRLPFLVMIVKNMKKYFTFEIQILDDKDMHRRFRVSNFQSTTKVRPFCTTMPIGLSSGWNQIQFNLADFTRRAYGTMYLETMRVQVHANVRIRRIYFADRLYSEEEMPSEYRLFIPLSSHKGSKGKELDVRSSKEQATEAVISKPSREAVKKVEGSEPAAAPPSPVGTEAILAEQSGLLVGEDILSEGRISEEMRTESAPSESGVSETSEVPPSDLSPSEEAGTEEEKGEEKPPAEGGEPVSEGETEEVPESTAEGDAPAEVSTEAPVEGEASAEAEAPAGSPSEAPDATEAPAEASGETPVEAPAEAEAEAEAPAEGE